MNQGYDPRVIGCKDFDEVIDVNVKGVANVIRHFVPAMVKRKSGIIVNFSSGWGRETDARVAPYCATKWAIEGLTRSLAQDLPKGMAAIPLNPGIIDTEMLRSCFGEEAGNYPTAVVWADLAVPYLLGLNASDNGKPRTSAYVGGTMFAPTDGDDRRQQSAPHCQSPPSAAAGPVTEYSCRSR